MIFSTKRRMIIQSVIKQGEIEQALRTSGKYERANWVHIAVEDTEGADPAYRVLAEFFNTGSSDGKYLVTRWQSSKEDAIDAFVALAGDVDYYIRTCLERNEALKQLNDLGFYTLDCAYKGEVPVVSEIERIAKNRTQF